ncbi:MAG: class I SAM-dependent rRNA methyltransferase [Verrucomicrobiales bacterium]|nr:class I SAM-dependent rRNA methyltransferase [Verrucomicrobiales bacterium]
MPGLIIKPRARIFHGHEWVYSNEIKKTFGNPNPGDVVSLKDYRDRHIGSAIFNPKSQIVARRFSRRKQVLDTDFFASRINRAIKWRSDRTDIDLTLCRLVWSESDGLPGVIIDRYGDYVVIQTLTLAMDMRIESIANAVMEALSPKAIIARNDSPSRIAEGLDQETSILRGNEPDSFDLIHNGTHFTIDLLSGQKTGLYLDQLDNYKKIAKLCHGKEILDCFTNQGGFALNCSLQGADSVTAIDISERAIQTAQINADKSGTKNITWLQANVFDELKKYDSEDRNFDLIILDPPSFTRNKKSLSDAMRGYKEIHLRSLKILQPGGILTTFTCSHHVSDRAFLDMIKSASVDSKRNLRLIAEYNQRADHPVNPLIPETSYLKGYSFEVLPSW